MQRGVRSATNSEGRGGVGVETLLKGVLLPPAAADRERRTSGATNTQGVYRMDVGALEGGDVASADEESIRMLIGAAPPTIPTESAHKGWLCGWCMDELCTNQLFFTEGLCAAAGTHGRSRGKRFVFFQSHGAHVD